MTLETRPLPGRQAARRKIPRGFTVDEEVAARFRDYCVDAGVPQAQVVNAVMHLLTSGSLPEDAPNSLKSVLTRLRDVLNNL